MRLGRRASLLGALSLLAWTATASAECAWVAWQEWTIIGKSAAPFSEWTIIQAASSEKRCAEAADEQVKARAAFWRAPEPTPPGQNPQFTRQVEVSPNHVAVTDSTGYVNTYRFLCLPDTVDPRGPKGSAR